MKFQDIETHLKDAVDDLEHLFAPVADRAVKAGLADLAGDAAAVAAQVAADPTLATDCAKRDAALKLLTAKVEDQGVTLGENTIAAAATTALAVLDVQQAQPAAPPASPASP
jgi:hypothetical protein